MNDKWLKQYKENYSGKSPEAKEIEGFLKETYNGASYIPWATMERLTYMQDPNAEFKTILDEEFTGSKLVHTDYFVNENSVENNNGIVNKTSAMVMSHFVKVSCTFLGKTFIEEYPIQEQDYSAAKIYNQNLVNKALKRALAKVASRATGLGLKLYESKDLQFDEKEEEKKPEIKKTTKKEIKVEEPKVEETKKVELTDEQKAQNILDGGVTSEFLNGERTFEPQEVEEQLPVNQTGEEITTTGNYSKELIDLCNLIKTSDKDKMTKVLQSLNVPILRQHGFVLSLEDSDDVLCEKLSHFQDVNVFTRAINNMLD